MKDLIKPAVFDSHGVFKYIQIKLTPVSKELVGEDAHEVVIVRGWQDCGYHADILQRFRETEFAEDESLEELFTLSCPGGGRVDIDSDQKKFQIYGYSQGFGRCDHALSQAILEGPDSPFADHEVTWSNEGY